MSNIKIALAQRGLLISETMKVALEALPSLTKEILLLAFADMSKLAMDSQQAIPQESLTRGELDYLLELCEASSGRQDSPMCAKIRRMMRDLG